MADAWADLEGLKKQIDTGKVTAGELFGTREYLENNYLYRMAGAVLGIYGNSKQEAMYPAYAIDADHAYIFLRWEYRLAAKRLQKAIDEAYDAGYLGPRVLDSGYGLELGLHISGGRYICGEETALLNALEGKRATPRAKPPFPQVSGLFGMPTIVQNVETLCNLPHIVENGAAWYKALSRCEDGGTKLYGVSGKVKRPMCVELPMGTPMREILEEHAGGMQDGLTLRGWLPGGASGILRPPTLLPYAGLF
jgi:NADH-quinone oxidoreductase subunit F